jgi:drug/metabolite transporter (DMT)-like permease
MLGIMAAIIGAVVTILNGMYSKSHDHFVVSFYQMIGAFLGTGAALPIYMYYIVPNYGQYIDPVTWEAPENRIVELLPSLADYMYLIALALVFSVFAYSMLIRILKTISPFVVALTLNLSPVYGLIIAYISDPTERMDMYFYSGAIIIFASVLVTPIASLIFSERTKPSVKVT